MKTLVMYYSVLLFSIIGLLKLDVVAADEQTSDRNIRRHFLLAFDISGEFVSRLNMTSDPKETLTALFENRIPSSSSGGNSTGIKREHEYDIPFFDPKKDEISSFHFGIPKRNMEWLSYDKFSSDKRAIVKNFKKEFISKTALHWRDQRSKGSNIQTFIDRLFDGIPQSGFGEGITLSNYVYPLVFDVVDSNLYADEYILIIVSDFLTGSEFGNKEDYLRLRDAYKYSYTRKLSDAAAPNVILNYINGLSNAFYPIKYFEYVFRTDEDDIGIVAYKIRPKVGMQRPEDVSIFIDGNVEIEQLDYQGSEYRLSENKLRFSHNSKVKVEKLVLGLETHAQENQSKTFTHDIFEAASGNYLKPDNYTAKDSGDKNRFPPQYHLKERKELNLNDAKLGDVVLTYTANVAYTPSDDFGVPINYSYSTQRYLDAQDIDYKSELSSYTFKIWLILILVLLLLLYVLIILAKPNALSLEMETVPNDSFEEINYKNDTHQAQDSDGRKIHPYQRWTQEKESQIYMIKGRLKLGNPMLRMLWKDKVYVKIVHEKSVPGYEIHLIDGEQSIAGNDHALKVRYSKTGSFEFEIELKKVDTLISVDRLMKFEFALEAYYEKSFLFFSKTVKTDPILKYGFYIGPELGNQWVGLDPGTTGSCIAVGADGYSEVFIPKTATGEDLIVPSMITFLPSANQEELRGGAYYEDVKYFYGEAAVTNSKREQYSPRTFRSIKKLLGFTDKIQLDFTKNPIGTYEVEGKQLCGLLLEGVYEKLQQTVVDERKKEFLVEGNFVPKRAVIAIPNNFTAQKIQDIVDSVKSLGQFQEVRCIYEAEANLMYYLFGVKTIDKNRTVLLFDMGGATINATVASVREKKTNSNTTYAIDILGKLGYGIGGDTIDYALINFLRNYLPDVGVYGNPFDFSYDAQLKERLVDLALEMKKEMIKNYDEQKELLIDNLKLGSLIKEAFKGATNVSIGVEDAIMEGFTRKENGTYPFFEDEEVKKLLFDNVKTVVEDILAVSSVAIDQIIFSGRSVVFPKIQETVLAALGGTEDIDVQSLSIDELKSAVAKGACLYGMNRSRVHLNSANINSWFAVKHSTSAHRFDLIELIPLGAPYQENDTLRKVLRRKPVVSDFGLDGGMVNFYQIMGANPKEALKKAEKHKYNLLQQVRVESKSEGVGIEVRENDDVICEVKEQGDKKAKRFSTIVADHEVGDANDEHYTWIIK